MSQQAGIRQRKTAKVNMAPDEPVEVKDINSAEQENKERLKKQFADPNELIPITEGMSFSDEMRAKARARRLGYEVPSASSRLADVGGGAGGFSIFGKFDLILFLFLGTILYFWVKTHHNVDLLFELWERVKPAYDEGHWHDL